MRELSSRTNARPRGLYLAALVLLVALVGLLAWWSTSTERGTAREANVGREEELLLLRRMLNATSFETLVRWQERCSELEYMSRVLDVECRVVEVLALREREFEAVVSAIEFHDLVPRKPRYVIRWQAQMHAVAAVWLTELSQEWARVAVAFGAWKRAARLVVQAVCRRVECLVPRHTTRSSTAR